MAELTWDAIDEREYNTGVDHGVLYVFDEGAYGTGVAWSGLTTVTESPSGAEATAQYADNIKWLNLVSAEQFGGTIEAFMSPPEFDACDGMATPTPGVSVGMQGRKTFGFVWRTKVGTATDPDAGHKLHLVWGALAAPSEKANATVNDSPAALDMSWTFTTTPVEVGTVGGVEYKPTSYICINSLKVDAGKLATLETTLFGGTGGSANPTLPSPAAVITAIMPSTVAEDVSEPAEASNEVDAAPVEAGTPQGDDTPTPPATGSSWTS